MKNTYLTLTLAITAMLFTAGCTMAPLKGGKATTTGHISQSIAQGDNPAQTSRQDQETVRTKSYTVPAGSRLVEARVTANESGALVTNMQAVVVSAPMPVVEHEETRAKTVELFRLLDRGGCRHQAVCAYFDEIGDGAFLPGTERPSDRFVRASHYLGRSAPTSDLATGVAEVFSITRNVSVPMVAPRSDEPNVAPTNWRTAIDHRELTYYFESTLQPNVFWVEVPNLDLAEGAPILRLEAENGPFRNGDTSSLFEPVDAFAFLTDGD